MLQVMLSKSCFETIAMPMICSVIRHRFLLVLSVVGNQVRNDLQLRLLESVLFPRENTEDSKRMIELDITMFIPGQCFSDLLPKCLITVDILTLDIDLTSIVHPMDFGRVLSQ